MNTGAFVYGALMAVLAIIGLFLAAKAHDSALEIAGFLFFAFGVLQHFALIKKHAGPTDPPGPRIALEDRFFRESGIPE